MGELYHRANISLLGFGVEFTQRYIIDHALAQWAGSRVRMCHGSAPVEGG